MNARHCSQLQARAILAGVVVLIASLSLLTQLPYARANPPTLVAGTYVDMAGSYVYDVTGTGTHQGEAKLSASTALRILILSSDANSVTYTVTSQYNYTCSSVGQVFPELYCKTPTSSFSQVEEATVDANRIIQSITEDGKATSRYVGVPSYYLIDPSKMTDNGTTPFYWCVPTSDATSCTDSTVNAHVFNKEIDVNGNSATVWLITYLGPHLGSYRNSAGVYSIGQERLTYEYDPQSGLAVSQPLYRFDAVGSEPDGSGSWTEHIDSNFHFVDSSLAFPAASTTTLSSTSSISSSETQSVSSLAGNSSAPMTTSAQTMSQPNSTDILSLIQSNMAPLLGGIIVILVIVVAALARRKPSKPTPASTIQPGRVYCKQCGTPTTTSSEYCGKCGAKI